MLLISTYLVHYFHNPNEINQNLTRVRSHKATSHGRVKYNWNLQWCPKLPAKSGYYLVAEAEGGGLKYFLNQDPYNIFFIKHHEIFSHPHQSVFRKTASKSEWKSNDIKAMPTRLSFETLKSTDIRYNRSRSWNFLLFYFYTVYHFVLILLMWKTFYFIIFWLLMLLG